MSEKTMRRRVGSKKKNITTASPITSRGSGVVIDVLERLGLSMNRDSRGFVSNPADQNIGESGLKIWAIDFDAGHGTIAKHKHARSGY